MKKLFSLFAIALVFMFVVLPFASAENMREQFREGARDILVNDNLSVEQKRELMQEQIQSTIGEVADNRNITPARAAKTIMAVNKNLRQHWEELSSEQQNRIQNLDPRQKIRLLSANSEQIKNFMSLDKKDFGNLTKLSRGELNKLGNMTEDEIQSHLSDYNFDKINRIKNNYKARVITQERLGQLRENFNNMKEKYSEAKDKLQNARERFNELKSSRNKTESVDAAKGYLDAHIDAVIKYLDQVQIKIESNENIDADLANELGSEVSSLLETLKVDKVKLADAETKDEVKEISVELKNETLNVRFAAQAILGKLVGSNMDEVFVRALHLEKKADAVIEYLVNEGTDVDSLDTLVTNFSDIVSDANEMNQEGKDLFDVARENADENQIQEARGLIKASHDRLKEAYDVYKEFWNEAKDFGYNGRALQYNETTEEYDVVEA